MKHRKGAVLGISLIYFVYFLMMAIVFAGIYGGLFAFFGKGYDYRQEESNLLLQRVKECFNEEDFFSLNSELDENLFFEKCKIDKKVISDGDYLIYSKNSGDYEFSVGVADFKVRCFLDTRYKNRDFPLCVEFKDNDGNYLLIGSSQNSKRVLA